MTFIPTPFQDVILFKSNSFQDSRGSFSEHFASKDFENLLGRKIYFCQDNLSRSKKGVLRGLHYQLPPFAQSKLVSVIQGTVLDVVVDIRKGSSTFGHHFSKELSADNQLQLYVPRGFAHGFITLSETSIFLYKVDQYYHFESEGSIAANDPALDIDWKISEKDWIQSSRDRMHPTLEKASVFDFKDKLYD